MYLSLTNLSPSSETTPLCVSGYIPFTLRRVFEVWNSDNFEKIRITWKDTVKAGIMSKEEVEFARKTLSEDEFVVWYEARWRQLGEDMFLTWKP